MSYGAECPMEPHVLWIQMSYGAKYPMEWNALWKGVFFKKNVLWSRMSYRAECPVTPVLPNVLSIEEGLKQ